MSPWLPSRQTQKWPPSLQSSSPANSAPPPCPVHRHHRAVCAVARESRTEKKVGSRVRVVTEMELPRLCRHRIYAASPLPFSPPPSLLWLVSSPENHHRWREEGPEKEDETCDKGDAQRRNRFCSFKISERFLTPCGCYSHHHRCFTLPLSLEVIDRAAAGLIWSYGCFVL
ncbi:uncharacterized protein LOC127745763 [Arachis duranensis]|uniref:Uncharacterized protein LOC127745763 n=1 Tax=Arachis duranensis TaxID=130453 RepID=A0A9C6WH55_ARADU|nr:uncharacterized protein LOC127745763 [Arachis duranensis]XP_052115443.1 uncharacterized protein LOC127745763 [Arachis duranensis]XP_052115444.1 uncharacterized protein LOC127745763 [Arachis duranensis]